MQPIELFSLAPKPGPMLRSQIMSDRGRPRGGAFTDEKSVPIATRVPNEVYEKVLAKAGAKERIAPWLRDIVTGAVQGRVAGTGATQTAGFAEGFRQGWAQANLAFRKALRAALDEIGGVPK